MANIAVVMRDRRLYEQVGRQLTASEVGRRMAHVVRGATARYALPGIAAYNFVCTRALAYALLSAVCSCSITMVRRHRRRNSGGGAASLAVDRQGKTFAQQVTQTTSERAGGGERARARIRECLQARKYSLTFFDTQLLCTKVTIPVALLNACGFLPSKL